MTKEDYGEYWWEWNLNNQAIYNRFQKGEINKVETADLLIAEVLRFNTLVVEYLKTIFVSKDDLADFARAYGLEKED